jgi:hypothetical protein
MARRASKAPTPGKSAAAASRNRPSTGTLSTAADAQARILALESERQKLAADLSAARNRIEDLERRQAEIADRIAWALDSLHDLLSDKN